MRGKSGTNALLVVCCIDMVLVELPRLFLSVGMAMDGSRRESLVIMCIFVLSLLGLVGVAFGKWILLMAGLVGHALMATSGISYLVRGVCTGLPSVYCLLAIGYSLRSSSWSYKVRGLWCIYSRLRLTRLGALFTFRLLEENKCTRR